MRRILVLDDDKIQHLLLRKRVNLITTNVEFKSFEKPVDALKFINENPVDMILSDLNLGIMDGWEFVEELDKVNFGGKLYLLTGSVILEDRERALSDPRISGFFEKPISESDLIQILKA